MDEDGLSNEQVEKVLQLQDLTGIEDINVCRDMLVRHQWDLEASFTFILWHTFFFHIHVSLMIAWHLSRSRFRSK